MPSKTYIGDELEIFAKAENWKSYFSRFIIPHLGKNVLEVGAGIGATTAIFAGLPRKSWLCLEPDLTLLARVEAKIAQGELPSFCRVQNGTISDLDADSRFDSILYIDVLEHIEKDRAELAQASRYLRAGGKIIVLSPAYQSLYSPFDKAIGHFRRYDKKSLAKISPPKCNIIKLIYLDSVGAFLSFANRLFLRQNNPTDTQIRFWDQRIVPVSRVADKLLGYRTGRSILAVWEKE